MHHASIRGKDVNLSKQWNT